jgi:hypothetical protein
VIIKIEAVQVRENLGNLVIRCASLMIVYDEDEGKEGKIQPPSAEDRGPP